MIVQTKMMYKPIIVSIGPPMLIIHQIGENGLIFIFTSLVVTSLKTVTIHSFSVIQSVKDFECLCIIGFSAISYSGIALNDEIDWFT